MIEFLRTIAKLAAYLFFYCTPIGLLVKMIHTFFDAMLQALINYGSYVTLVGDTESRTLQGWAGAAALVNLVFPLTEAFTMLTGYLSLWASIIIIRWFKSIIPGFSN